MSSEVAKKAAGTFIGDLSGSLPMVCAWITHECRKGSLAPAVSRFCQSQPEILEAAQVIVETVSGECVHCRIPFAGYDHESSGVFNSEVRFTLDPLSGECRRMPL